MDVFIFKKIDNQYYVNWYYFSIMVISILVISTLLGYGSTSDWDELLYEQYNCDILGQTMVAFPNDSSAYERYASCKSSSEITGFTPSFFFYLIVVAIAFGTRVMINWELEKPFMETELEEWKVSKKGYAGFMLFLLFTICCVVASLFLFYSQADDFHSSLSSLRMYDDPDMPNWFLINLFLMLPILLPLTALAILALDSQK
jgi:hypothetical protein